MNLSRIKSRDPSVAIWPGDTFPIGLRPIAQNRIDDARARGLDLFSALGLDPGGYYFGLWFGAEILSMTLTTPRGDVIYSAAEIASEIGSRELLALIKLWEKVQDQSEPDPMALEAEIELQCFEGVGEAVGDMTRAIVAESAVAFYGDRVSDLTDGQVLYYCTLRSVHRKRTESQGVRCVSLEMLEQTAGRKRKRHV